MRRLLETLKQGVKEIAESFDEDKFKKEDDSARLA